MRDDLKDVIWLSLMGSAILPAPTSWAFGLIVGVLFGRAHVR